MSTCDPDAGGPAPTAGPTPAGILGWTIVNPERCPDRFALHVPAEGAWLIRDGEVERWCTVHELPYDDACSCCLADSAALEM